MVESWSCWVRTLPITALILQPYQEADVWLAQLRVHMSHFTGHFGNPLTRTPKFHLTPKSFWHGHNGSPDNRGAWGPQCIFNSLNKKVRRSQDYWDAVVLCHINIPCQVWSKLTWELKLTRKKRKILHSKFRKASITYFWKSWGMFVTWKTITS